MLANLTPSDEKTMKPVVLAQQLAAQGAASLAVLQKLASKLRTAHAAVVSGLGRAALKPIYKLVAEGGGAFPKDGGNCLQ